MDKINFLAKPDFPLSTNTFDHMQNMIYLAASLAVLGGKNYILSGCKDMENGEVSGGLIVVDGEIIRFKGGAKKAKFTIRTAHETLEAFGKEYPESYTFRDALFSDSGEYNWDDFKESGSIQDIKKQIDDLRGDAPGTVQMWSGLESKIPLDYMLCDGRVLSTNEYPELFDNIGFTHGVEGTTGFKLPNLKGRFIVGYDNQQADYSSIGKQGGKDKVTLSEAEMPRHRHKYSDDTNAQGKFPDIEVGFPQTYGGINTTNSSGSSSGSGTVYYSSYEGGKDGQTQAHENRPSFYTLAYIIKVK